MEDEISYKELIQMLKKRFSLIINFILIGILIGGVYTFFIAIPEYSSSTQLLVNRTQQADAIQRSDIDTNIQLINTYVDIINGPVILDGVREELNLDISHSELSDKITISNEMNSQVFSIQVTDPNPFQAASIANTTADIFRENLDEIMSVDNVTVISQAESNNNPISPNHRFNFIFAALLGGMIGIGLSFLFEILDNTVKNEKFIVDELGWTSLGIISEMNIDELKSVGPIAKPEHAQNESRSARSRV